MSDPVAQQMGSDIATRMMVRHAFEILFTLSDDPDRERSETEQRLLEMASRLRLPPMSTDMIVEVRTAMKREIKNTLANEAVPVN